MPEIDRIGLQKLLQENGIPLDKWGTDTTKTIEHLLREIEYGEALLSSDDGLLRIVRTVGVHVRYNNVGSSLYLVEEKQVFKNGYERRRKLGVSLAEKMKNGETPEIAARRAIIEELGIYEELSLVFLEDQLYSHNSQSYPGLKSRYEIYFFNAWITENQFRAGGYQEVQEDKTTFFIWEKQ